MKKVGIISRVTVDLIYSGIDRMPEPGEELLSKSFTLAPGGGAVVSAVALNRLGATVKTGLFMGSGIEGKLAYDLLNRQGLKNYINLTAEGQPVVFSSVFSFGGERSIISYDEGYPSISEDEILNFYTDCDIAVLPDFPAPADKIKATGKLVIFDPNLPAVSRIKQILRCIDILTPNLAEAFAITGESDVETALLALVNSGVSVPVIKLGGEGCAAYSDGQIIRLPVKLPVTAGDWHVADTTGAGDNFLAGLLYGLSLEWPIVRCLETANMLGAASTTGIGAFAQKFTAEDIENGYA